MSGLEAVAHALAGSTGGIVAMGLLYPLENIRARLQVQVKRKASTKHLAGDADAAERGDGTAAVPAPLVHTHDRNSVCAASPPPPEECISPDTPHPPVRAAAIHPAPAGASAGFVPLNTPRRTVPPPEQAVTCLACLSERAHSSASAVASAVAGAPAKPAMSGSSSNGTYVLPSGEIVYDFKGSLDCVRQVCAREGPLKLYTGLSSALVGVGCSSATYFYFYYSTKTLLLRYTGLKNLGPLHNLLVASVSGVLNVFLTLPIWLVNTRMTVGAPLGGRQYSSIWDAVQRIYEEEGVRGFYRGLIPSLILVSNPAIQFVVYEQCIRILSKHAARVAAQAAQVASTVGSVTDAAAAAAAASGAAPPAVKLSSVHFFMLGAFAKAVATVATYPYQVVKSRQQASRSEHGSTAGLVARMWREEGPSAFFSGMGAKMSQTVLNSAFMFAVYERLVVVILRFLKWMSAEYKQLPKPAP